MGFPKSGDLTENIVKSLKLDPPLPRKVIQQVQDALSLLRFKNAIGSFGKYDNDRKRVCAILEYEAREQCGMQIPMDKLAKTAYMRKTDFVQFHQTIGHFRENMTSRSKEETINVSKINHKSAANLQKSSIDRLAVQLGAFVPNSSFVASQAQKLFHTIYAHLKDSTSQKSHHKRIHALQDLQRNQQAYEASCFFLVATNTTSNSQNKQKIMRTTDDANDKPLDLPTFLNATTHSFSKATFEMVLKYVKELQEEIVQTQGECVKASTKYVPSAATLRMQGAVKRKRNDNLKIIDAANKSQNKSKMNKSSTMKSATDMVLQIAEQQDKDREADRTTSDKGAGQHGTALSPQFIALKQKIVQAACEKANESWKAKQSEHEMVASDKKTEKPNLLHLAVQQVLLQHGLQ